MQRTDPLDLLIGHWWLVGLISDGNGPLGCVKVERHSSQLTKGSQEEHRPVTMRQVSFRRPAVNAASWRLDGVALYGWPVVYPR